MAELSTMDELELHEHLNEVHRLPGLPARYDPLGTFDYRWQHENDHHNRGTDAHVDEPATPRGAA